MATLYSGRHDECGYVGTPTSSRARAERALREHSCDGAKRRRLPAAGDACRLSIELPAELDAPAAGDWITTRAGSRYLVTDSRPVPADAPGPLVRYRLRCTRLAWDCPVPAGVRAIELHRAGAMTAPTSTDANTVSPDEER